MHLWFFPALRNICLEYAPYLSVCRKASCAHAGVAAVWMGPDWALNSTTHCLWGLDKLPFLFSLLSSYRGFCLASWSLCAVWGQTEVLSEQEQHFLGRHCRSSGMWRGHCVTARPFLWFVLLAPAMFCGFGRGSSSHLAAFAPELLCGFQSFPYLDDVFPCISSLTYASC